MEHWQAGSLPTITTWEAFTIIKFFYIFLQLLSFFTFFYYIAGFPGGSDGKEYACNVGDWVLDPSSLRMNFLPEGSSLPCKRIYIEVIPPFPQTSQKIPKCPWK